MFVVAVDPFKMIASIGTQDFPLRRKSAHREDCATKRLLNTESVYLIDIIYEVVADLKYLLGRGRVVHCQRVNVHVLATADTNRTDDLFS